MIQEPLALVLDDQMRICTSVPAAVLMQMQLQGLMQAATAALPDYRYIYSQTYMQSREQAVTSRALLRMPCRHALTQALTAGAGTAACRSLRQYRSGRYACVTCILDEPAIHI